MRASTLEQFRAHFNASLEQAIIDGELRRQEKWTAGVAGGCQDFVEKMKLQIRGRQHMNAQQESGTWVLRDDYSGHLDAQNASIAQPGG